MVKTLAGLFFLTRWWAHWASIDQLVSGDWVWRRRPKPRETAKPFPSSQISPPSQPPSHSKP